MIGVDWGTTQLRAYRVDAEGKLLEARTAAKGILSVKDGDFGSALQSAIGDWVEGEAAPVMMCGMIGSRQGWVEAPYVPCPATAEEIAGALAEVSWGPGRRAFICPGLACTDTDGVPDLMRGEEVQAIGALALGGEETMTTYHPGTHSKHVTAERGRIIGFSTFMTGEVFAVLKEHSILGRTMAEGPADWPSFDEGVRRAHQPGGVLHHLFGARTRVLTGGLGAIGAADYLSGILIGHELAGAPAEGPIVVVGAARLAERYVRALRSMGREAQAMDADAATISGLSQIDALARRRTAGAAR